MTPRKPRRRGAVRHILESGVLEVYRLDALALVAFGLIGTSVARVAPDWLYAYAGVVLLLVVMVLGKTKPQTSERPN
jgi:hypothetical protein